MQGAKLLRPLVLSLILCASHSRTFSLINGYGAPLEVYKILEHHDEAGPGNCHVLLSVFSLIQHVYELQLELLMELTLFVQCDHHRQRYIPDISFLY